MQTDIDIISFKGKIKNYSMLATVLWARLNDQPGQIPGKAKVVVNSDVMFQTFQGTGAAFSEIGGKSLKSVDKSKQSEVLKELFDRKEGSGFNYCRLPIGSSDFALSAYSLNDTDGDYEMKEFSLDRDQDYLIPFIKDAYKFSPELKIHASPWSPPAWLKDNKDFVNGGSLIDDDKTYKAYAKYLSKYIRAYKDQGINIEKLLIQNEQDSVAIFPSCIMEPEQMLKFISDYLKPEFTREGINSEIWAGTFRTISGFQAHEFMKQNGACELVDGVGFQYSLTEHINDFTRSFPGVKIMHTETPCYRGDNTWEQAISLFNHFIDFMNTGCEIFSYWNMILDEKSESTWGWKQNSLVTIKDNGEVIYNPDFHIMKLLSSHITPGARRIQCLCMVKQSIAFKNPDGSIVIFICNLNDQDIQTIITLDNQEREITLPGSSIIAYSIK